MPLVLMYRSDKVCPSSESNMTSRDRQSSLLSTQPCQYPRFFLLKANRSEPSLVLDETMHVLYGVALFKTPFGASVPAAKSLTRLLSTFRAGGDNVGPPRHRAGAMTSTNTSSSETPPLYHLPSRTAISITPSEPGICHYNTSLAGQ